MEILNTLTEQLGISEDQAKGGAGAIFQRAKEILGDEHFSMVADVVPGMDALQIHRPD